MENLDIQTFILFKTHHNTQELKGDILSKINILFPDVDNKNKNKNNKKNNNNILKNQKIQSLKDNICNKVNLILNKLSEKNIDNLVIEFIENINQVSSDIFNEIQKTIYLKIMSEINFINIYIEFLKIIGYLYNNVQGYTLSYFYNIVETKFNFDYTNFEIDPNNNLSFIIDINGETNRINNLIIINSMVKYNFLSININNYCDEIILDQKLFLSDIYYWFNSKNRKLLTSEVIKIKEILNKKEIAPRDMILLKNILQDNDKTSTDNIPVINTPVINTPVINTSVINTKVISTNQKDKINDLQKDKKNNQTNTINLECNHIIDEYLLFKSMDDLKYFIDIRCTDTINKNKFCENLINKFFIANKEKSEDFIQLIKQLVKLRVLFKSNFSRGLLLIHNNWDEFSIDYDNSTQKIKLLLSTLKSIGITKGLEDLLQKYNV